MNKLTIIFVLVFSYGFSQTAPISQDISAATEKNTNSSITLVATDEEFQGLTYTIVSQPTYGIATLNGSTVTYVPSEDYIGIDSFTYKSNDGSLESNTSTVSIKVFSSFSQFQSIIGTDIDGEVAGDFSGYSVSLSADGTTVAIGAPTSYGSTGYVRVYRYNGSSWMQLGSDIDGEAAGDGFGSSVSISSDGTTVAIGAPFNDGNGTSSGHVRVYKYNGSTWTQLGLDIDSEAAADSSGVSVSLSSDGTKLAIGASGNNGNGTASGQVRVYRYSGASWIQLGADIDGEASFDISGQSVSLSADGTTLAIGAPSLSGDTSGKVSVYKYNGSLWTQLGVVIEGEGGNDRSGHSVSISADGTTLAIGAYNNDGKGTNSGHVRVYNYIGSNWTQLGTDIDGEASNDSSGRSVSLSADGTLIAIGASVNSGVNGFRTGHIRVYQFTNNTWIQLGSDIDGESENDDSGYSVSLSADGTTVAIGSYLNSGNGIESGHVRVYNLTNSVPIANAQDVTATENIATTITLSGTDADGDTLSYAIVSPPTNGTAVLDGNTVTYTCTSDTATIDSFSFIANDGEADSDTAIVDITVTAVNDAPIANAQVVTATENIATTITLSGTDADGDTLSYAIVSPPTNGTAVLDGNTVTYTCTSDTATMDSFSFVVNDGEADSDAAIVDITVTAVNDAPIANAQDVTATENIATTITLSGTDADGDTLSYAIVSPPTNGTAVLDGNTVTYTSTSDTAIMDSFSFVVNDGEVDSDAVIVDITVTAVNDAPSANAQDVTATENIATTITLSGTDADGDTLSYAIVSPPTNGTAVLDGNTVTYTSTSDTAIMDSFSFVVNDGEVDSDAVIVDITVTAVNDAPIANAQVVTATENIATTITLSGTDADGDTLSYAIVSPPTNGTAVLDGNTVTYTSTSDTAIMDSFSFVVNDGEVDSDAALVDITVTAAINLPITNYELITTSLTCIGSNDGVIDIFVADTNYSYKVTIANFGIFTIPTGVPTISIKNMPVGKYDVCLSIEGQTGIEQCYELTIGEPDPLSVSGKLSANGKSYDLSLTGSNQYYIKVNGETRLITQDNYSVTLKYGLNLIEVATNLVCQGSYTKEIFISDELLFFPNPTEDYLTVYVGNENRKVQIQISTLQGIQVHKQVYEISETGIVILDIKYLSTGTYMVYVSGAMSPHIFKFIKR